MPEKFSYLIKRNTSMKVFSQLYVGLKKQAGEVPLGFATPLEDNAQGRKRQDTVNSWAKDYGSYVDGKLTYPHFLGIKTVDNVPVPNFKITDDIKRVYWGGGNVVWRVEDPRGFELEIQSSNLMAIVQSCGIEAGGLIPGKCIWGRDGASNILLHESSAEFKDAVMAAETLKAPKQVGKASRKPGQLYRLTNGSLGIYVGKVHVVVAEHSLTASKNLVNKPSEEFEAILGISDISTSLEHTSELKLYKKAPLVSEVSDPAKRVEMVLDNQFLLSTSWSFASASYTPARIMSVTREPIKNPVLCIVPLPKSLFDSKLEALKQYAKHHKADVLSKWLLPWRGDELIRINNILVGTIFDLKGSMIGIATELRAHEYEIYRTDHYGRQSFADTKLKFTKLPELKTNDAVIEYANHLYNTGCMYYITATEGTNMVVYT